MLNWLQHLFTVRALQTELAAAKERIAEIERELFDVKSENEQLKNNAAIQELQLQSKRKSTQRIAHGVDENPFGF